MAERLRTSDAAPFIAAHRLRQKSQFDLVYREGRRFSDNLFLILARPNSSLHARLGLSVAAKNAGNAVNRNRIKRAVRESFRHYSSRLPAVDIVVNARAGAKAAANSALAHSLEQLWDKLARHA
jgi:ribonuclease P protein component